MNGVYLYFVNKHFSSWALLGLSVVNSTTSPMSTSFSPSPRHKHIHKNIKNSTIGPFQRNLAPLTLSQTSPGFFVSANTSLLKTLWEKEKLLVTSNFSLSHSVFYPFGELSPIFIEFEIVVCKLFQFGSFLILSFGKGFRSICMTGWLID